MLQSDLDNRRPGYSRAKEELKGFLCKVSVERSLQSQQRATGADYKNQKRQLLEFLRVGSPARIFEMLGFFQIFYFFE